MGCCASHGQDEFVEHKTKSTDGAHVKCDSEDNVDLEMDIETTDLSDGLLDMFNTLYNQKTANHDIDETTGLPSVASLVYSLQTCIVLQDAKWVLAMCDINNLTDINDKIGYSGANHKIEEIGKIISKFVSQKPFEMKAFRNSSNGKGALFAIVIYCDEKFEIGELYMKRLKDKIFDYSNETVSIGMTRINKYDNVNDWIDRANNCLIQVKKNNGNNVLFDKIDYNKNNKQDTGYESKNSEDVKEISLGNKQDLTRAIQVSLQTTFCAIVCNVNEKMWFEFYIVLFCFSFFKTENRIRVRGNRRKGIEFN